ncbi:MAG: alkaline phosphatase family protein [Candidatus Omnitrophica bacterium]|nr:alkaline phosphatase family protein [Candidatus Omnitrophota bacterium]
MIKKKKIFIFIFFICLVGFIFMGVLSFTSGKQKVVLIGIDAATWEVIDYMISWGQLPTIKRLMDEGCYGPLATDRGESPVSWTSIATGKGMRKHGIIVDEQHSFESVSQRQRCAIKTNRVWDIAENYGKKVGVCDWYFLRPPRKINGFYVEGTCNTYPPELADELAQIEEDRFTYLLSNQDWDFAASLWHSVDEVQHWYWIYHTLKKNEDSYRYPKDLAENIDFYANKIYSSYRDFDLKLGKLLKRLDKNTSIVIVSDHGMRLISGRKIVRMNESFLKKIGVTKGWLDADSSLAEGSLQGVDFKVNIDYSNQYRANLFSFELLEYDEYMETPILNITFDAGAKKEKITAASNKMRDIFKGLAHDNIKIFKLAKKTEHELVFELSDDFKAYCVKVRSPTELTFLHIAPWTGEHGCPPQCDGIIIMHGPSFRKNFKIYGAHLYDTTPTILHLLGLPVGRDMDGKVLIKAFKFNLFQRVRYIDSHDTKSQPSSCDSDELRVLDEEEKWRLRSLGYL